jgi:predicted ATP-grasp superfamily ATP-dependent carboligase
MRDALVADVAALPGHQVVTTVDPRFPLRRPPAGVQVVTLGARRKALLDELLMSADAAWLVAPETLGRLERLAALAERRGVWLLGPSARAIRRAADKGVLPLLLARHGVPHPRTCLVKSSTDVVRAAREMGVPVVVKPVRGAGCDGVRLARSARELSRALDAARRSDGAGIVLQRYVPGLAASVSLLADGRGAVALAVNGQSLRVSRSFAYRGGATPLDHPLASRAAAVARRACEALPGLRGYVGVDVVLTDGEAVVIEVNPRLTTSYLGVRAALDANVAGLALAACAGTLPAVPPPRRAVRFTAAGRVLPA